MANLGGAIYIYIYTYIYSVNILSIVNIPLHIVHVVQVVQAVIVRQM